MPGSLACTLAYCPSCTESPWQFHRLCQNLKTWQHCMESGAVSWELSLAKQARSLFWNKIPLAELDDLPDPDETCFHKWRFCFQNPKTLPLPTNKPVRTTFHQHCCPRKVEAWWAGNMGNTWPYVSDFLAALVSLENSPQRPQRGHNMCCTLAIIAYCQNQTPDN